MNNNFQNPAQIIPSFTVKDSTGASPPSIKHCFLERMLLDITIPPPVLRAANGQVYQAVYDNVTIPPLDSDPAVESRIIKVIVSFQSHTYGNYAIIRNAQHKASIVPIIAAMLAGEPHAN